MKKELLPQLRFSGFENGWILKKYDEIYTFYSTNSLSRDKLNYESGEVKNIHYGDIHTKFPTLFDISQERVPFVNGDIAISKIPSENYCQEGDLLIADASEDYKDVGKTIEIINLNNEKVLSGLHTFLARPQKQNMALGFAGFLLQTWYVREQVMKIAQGTKVLGLAKSRLGKIKLNIPSLPEQQKIATFLTAVDDKITKLTKKKALLEQYKKGAMQQLFSQEIRFKDGNGKDYTNWKEKKLGNIGKLIGGGTPSKNNKGYWRGDIPWISSSDLSENTIHRISKSRFITIEALNESPTKLIPKGSVLMVARVGIGKFAVTDEELCTSQDFASFISPNNPYFLAYYFTNESNIFIRLSQGTSILGFTNKEIKSAKFKIPCLEEQTKIADFLSAVDTKIDHITHQIQKTRVFKKGLLQQMFI